MLRDALRYAELGWPVLPLHFPTAHGCSCGLDCGSNAGKHPFELFVRHGVQQATTDPEVIEEWWHREPGLNVGIRCSRFLVLDVDPRNGGDGALRDFVRLHGRLPVTPSARTGSGGWHFLFERPPCLVRGKIVPGLDVKSAGGYIVAAPSMHMSGSPYRWLRDPSVQLAPLPPWLLGLIRREERPAPIRIDSSVSSLDRVRRARSYAAKLEPAVSGQGGHTHTFLVAQRIACGFGLSEGEAMAALAEWNATCQPPWSEADLRRKIREALSRGQVVGFGELLERSR